MKQIKFATIGTNFIVDWFLSGASHDPRFKHQAVYSRSQDTAEAFAAKHKVQKIFTSLKQMLADPEIDAVYIASPNSMHHQQTMMCLSAGKHVLCEKAFAANETQAQEMISTAISKNLCLMEAMKTTLSPTFAAVRDNLHKIGTVRRYFASYCQYSSRYDKLKEGIVMNAFDPKFAAGSLMDIGVYGVYPMVVLFGVPQKITSSAVKLYTGIDGQGSVICSYEGFDANIIHSKIADSSLPSEIQGEKGRIIIDRINTIDRAVIIYKNGDTEDISSQHIADDMYYEVSEFISMIENGQLEHPINSHQNTILTLQIMDTVREQNDILFTDEQL